MLRLLTIACAALFCASLGAADPTTDAKVQLTERGKLLLSDDFAEVPGKDWRTAKGKWEVKDGALVGSELKADMHNAVLTHNLPFHDAAIQLSFKLDGAKSFAVSINDAKGHVCRVQVSPTALAVKKDDHDKDGKGATLETLPLTLKTGTWHTLLVEMQGKDMLASIDDEQVAFGANDALDVDKSSVRLVVTGESVALKNLRVWEASPGKNWKTIREKLLEARKAREASK